MDFQGKLVVERSMAAELQDAVLARTPDSHAMPVGWISFGSIKAAVAEPQGLTGIAEYPRVATAAGG